MLHLGDITKINGASVEPVDCITFGSPCQDLSIAGKRAGLAGERSGLFMEATRIIKEMRIKTNGEYPKFAIWENVVGAFSSNNGEDFRAVLEELARCVEPGTVVPGPVKGKWAKAGCIAGDGWSVAWRTFDAQYWGVPQRRRRIAAVLDLGGQRAGEILFEREGMPGDSDKSIPTWQGSARDPQASTGSDDRMVGGQGTVRPVMCLQGGGATSQNSQGMGYHEEVAYTLNTTDMHGVSYGIDQQGGKGNASYAENVCPTILSDSHGTPHGVAYGIGSYASNAWKSQNPISGVYEADVSKTLDAINCGYPGCNQGGMAVCEPIAPCTVQIRGGCEGGGKGVLLQQDKTGSLTCMNDKTLFQPVVYQKDEKVGTLSAAGYDKLGTQEAMQGMYVTEAAAFQGITEPVGSDIYNLSVTGNTAASLTTATGQGASNTGPSVCEPVVFENHSQDSRYVELKEVCETVSAKYGTGGNNQPLVAESNAVIADVGFFTSFEEVSPTLLARDYKDPHIVTSPLIRWIVRRLTPKECERLQGFPDGWTDIGEWTDSKGKVHKPSDSARYKALGNSIALPQWWWITCKMGPYLPKGATLASLFDGIGGFPLVWETYNGTGTALWAAEIEEFPIAVTKLRFPEPEMEDWM